MVLRLGSSNYHRVFLATKNNLILNGKVSMYSDFLHRTFIQLGKEIFTNTNRKIQDIKKLDGVGLVTVDNRPSRK